MPPPRSTTCLAGKLQLIPPSFLFFFLNFPSLYLLSSFYLSISLLISYFFDGGGGGGGGNSLGGEALSPSPLPDLLLPFLSSFPSFPFVFLSLSLFFFLLFFSFFISFFLSFSFCFPFFFFSFFFFPFFLFFLLPPPLFSPFFFFLSFFSQGGGGGPELRNLLIHHLVPLQLFMYITLIKLCYPSLCISMSFCFDYCQCFLFACKKGESMDIKKVLYDMKQTKHQYLNKIPLPPYQGSVFQRVVIDSNQSLLKIKRNCVLQR